MQARSQQILDNHSLILQRIIQINKRKQTAISLVIDSSGRKLILKYCDTSNYECHLKFITERDFYRANRSEFIPELIYSGNDYICTEYVDGMTLLDHLNVQELQADNTELVSQLYTIANYFKSNEYSDGTCNEFSNLFVEQLSRLFNSGPWGVRRSLLEEVCFRLYWRMLKPFLIKKTKKIIKGNESKLRVTHVHNDLHQNNILVTKANKLYLIDFENYARGYCLLDLLYCMSTLYATGKVCRSTLISRLTKESESIPFFSCLLNVCFCTLQVNRKFYRSSTKNILLNLVKLSAFAWFGRKI